jgi:hypothetical protein
MNVEGIYVLITLTLKIEDHFSTVLKGDNGYFF